LSQNYKKTKVPKQTHQLTPLHIR